MKNMLQKGRAEKYTEQGRKMPEIKKFFTIFGLAALLLAGTGCTGKTAQVEEQVSTVPATMGSVRSVITFVGNVTSAQTSSLDWQTSGVIADVNFRIGDRVNEGDVLATLEKDSLSANVLLSENPLISAQEDLDELLASETPKAKAYKELKDKEAALADAEKYQESLKYPHAVSGDITYWAEQTEIYRQYYEEARSVFDDVVSWKYSSNISEHDLYENYRKKMLTALNQYAEVYNNYLYYSGKATENDFAQAGADIDVAQAEYEKALKNFLTYQTYPREKDVAAAQMNVEKARNTFDQRNIVADINGVVTAVNARSGDYVTKSQTAFRLDNIDHLYIPMDISEIDIVRIHDGMRALIVPDADTDKVYEGVVTTVSGSGDSSGNRVTFETMVEILKPDDALKVGMTAEVDIVLNESEKALLVPANAVFEQKGTDYVTVSYGIVTQDIPVSVGIVTDTVAEITGGKLKEGDSVCVPSIDNSTLRDMGLTSAQENASPERMSFGTDLPDMPGIMSERMPPPGSGNSAVVNENKPEED